MFLSHLESLQNLPLLRAAASCMFIAFCSKMLALKYIAVFVYHNTEVCKSHTFIILPIQDASSTFQLYIETTKRNFGRPKFLDL